MKIKKRDGRIIDSDKEKFKIKFSKRSRKFLNNCNEEKRERITKKIEELKVDPKPTETVKISAIKEKVYRVRDYRILYVINYERNQIYISKIDKRPTAYDFSVLSLVQNLVSF